jgi:integrase
MAGIDRPKGKPAMVAVPTEADIEAVLKGCTGGTAQEAVRNRALVRLMLESGIRRFELSALDYEDLDLKARTVMIKSTGPPTFCVVTRWSLTASRRVRLSRCPCPPGSCMTCSALSGSWPRATATCAAWNQALRRHCRLLTATC